MKRDDALASLDIGSPAPALRLACIDGTEVGLEDFRGRPLWLGFYRYASCPLCNLRIHHIRQRYAALHGDRMAILAVFQSPVERMLEYVGRREAGFPLLSDPDERTYAAYGLGRSWLGMATPSVASRMLEAGREGFLGAPDPDGTLTRLPGDFLLDESGRLEDVFYARDISDHIPFERVDAFLARRGIRI